MARPSSQRPRLLVVDDVMGSLSPDDFHRAIKEKLDRCAEISGCDILFPLSAAEALRVKDPSLIILDIDLGHWKKGLTGYSLLPKLEPSPGAIPLLVLSGEPKLGERRGKGPTGIRAFAQTHEVVWLDKPDFMTTDETFLANRIRSLATDIHNDGIAMDFLVDQRVLRFSRDGAVLGNYKLPSDVKGTFIMDLLVGILKGGNVGEDLPTFGEPGWESIQHVAKPHSEIGAFNAAVVRATNGHIGYKLLVNVNRRWKLALGRWEPLPMDAAKPSALDLIESKLAKLQARQDELTARIDGLEGSVRSLRGSGIGWSVSRIRRSK